MNFLQLVGMAMREAGISLTDPEPETLNNVVGLTLKFKNWISQAWSDIQIENDQDEFERAWFYVNLNPRFYFDLDETTYTQPFPGDVLVGVYSGATFEVTNVIIVNGGLWNDGTAQGIIEFENLEGNPQDLEPLEIQSSSQTSVRFVKWADYNLSSQTEMGNGYIDNLDDVWWSTLRLSDTPGADFTVQQKPLPYISFSQFSQNYDYNLITLGTPILVTESPDDGMRIFFYPPPDRTYTLGGYYYTTHPELTEDEDEPEGLKTKYHPMIAWRALEYYGMYQQNPAIVAGAKSRYDVFYRKMQRECEIPTTMQSVRLY